MGVGLALGQNLPTLTLTRDTSVIVITNGTPRTEGGRTVLNMAGCVEEARSNVFWGPAGELVSTRIDEDTLLLSTLVVVVRPDGDGQDQETLEARDATAVTFADRPPCLEEVDEAEPARVALQQGRTALQGSRFFLDQGADIATMDGPITWTREAEGEAPALSGDADRLEYDLDSDRTTLIGGVQVVSEGRVSEADRLELDEAAGVAILTGEPARSTENGNVLEGETLIYYLDSNDVVVEGNIRGTLEFE